MVKPDQEMRKVTSILSVKRCLVLGGGGFIGANLCIATR